MTWYEGDLDYRDGEEDEDTDWDEYETSLHQDAEWLYREWIHGR